MVCMLKWMSTNLKRLVLRSATGAAVVTIAIVVLSSTINSQSRVRVIPYRFESPISERLVFDDEIVQVTRVFDSAILERDPTASEAIEYAVGRSDFVGLVDVSQVDTSLVEDGAWVQTRLKGSIRELFKAQGYSKGQTVEVSLTGGELSIGKVLVRAGTVQRFLVPAQYLLFVTKPPDGSSTVLWIAYTPMVVTQGQLVSVWPPGVRRQRADPIGGMALADVVTLIRKFSKE